MAKVIKTVNWNGNRYTFSNTYKNTGFKSHDYLIMEDDKGNEWIGETTWINRPWHRFDLEEAFVQVVTKAFGKKARDLAYEICKDAHSVEGAIDEFFKQFKPEDIELDDEELTNEEVSRIKVLADYLEVDVEDIEETGTNEYTVDGETYLVLTDDEADEEYDSWCASYYDDLGLENFPEPIKDLVYEKAIDNDELEDFVRDDISSYVEDMGDEEIIEECINRDIIVEDDVYDEDGELKDDVDIYDLREQLSQEMFDNIDDYADYIRDLGYDDDFFDNYIDEDEVKEIVKDAYDVNGEGRGVIASYDGHELDLGNDLYAYRID